MSEWEKKQERVTRQTARLCWAVFASSDKKKRQGNWQVEDFVPQKPMSPEMRAKFIHAQAVVFRARQKSLERLKQSTNG